MSKADYTAVISELMGNFQEKEDTRQSFSKVLAEMMETKTSNAVLEERLKRMSKMELERYERQSERNEQQGQFKHRRGNHWAFYLHDFCVTICHRVVQHRGSAPLCF